MEHIKVEYKSLFLTQNGLLPVDGYSCVSFENIGTSKATLMNTIPLVKGGTIREFNNRPGEVIKTPIPVTFDPTDTNTQVLVVFTYYSI